MCFDLLFILWKVSIILVLNQSKVQKDWSIQKLLFCNNKLYLVLGGYNLCLLSPSQWMIVTGLSSILSLWTFIKTSFFTIFSSPSESLTKSLSFSFIKCLILLIMKTDDKIISLIFPVVTCWHWQYFPQRKLLTQDAARLFSNLHLSSLVLKSWVEILLSLLNLSDMNCMIFITLKQPLTFLLNWNSITWVRGTRELWNPWHS